MSATPAKGPLHPLDELVPYLMGELDPRARAAVDGHLDRCGACREELARLDAALVATVEALPPTAPGDHVWSAVAARVAAPAATATAAPTRTARVTPTRRAPPWRGGGWAAGGLAASLVLAVALGAWGVDQRQRTIDLRAELAAARVAAEARAAELLGNVAALEASVGALAAEQALVASWLADGDVAIAAIAGERDAVGAVLFRADGAALVVMREGPGPGRSLQAWGVAAGAVTSLGAFEGRVWEVSATGFEAVAVSLEPRGGSATPTEVLGAAPRG